MSDDQQQTIADVYLSGLRDLAAEHGEDYAFQAAAITMTRLLSMTSRAMYRLSGPPLFLPPDIGSEH